MVVQGAAAPASAIDVDIDLEFDAPRTTTVEYGQAWYLPLSAGPGFYYEIYVSSESEISITGASTSPEFLLYFDSSGQTKGSLSNSYDSPPLAVGSYAFSITATHTYSYGDTYHGETTSPGQLTITKAQLGVDLRMVDDASNRDATIISVAFSGRFVDEYQSSFFEEAPISPAGTWHVTVTDSTGEVAVERNLERSAGDDVLATSFYWADPKPGEEYSATAEFTPIGASADRFAVAPSSTVTYSAGASQPVPTSTSTSIAEPPHELAQPSEFAVPLWALILVIALTIGLAVLVTVVGVRLAKPPLVLHHD